MSRKSFISRCRWWGVGEWIVFIVCQIVWVIAFGYLADRIGFWGALIPVTAMGLASLIEDEL